MGGKKKGGKKGGKKKGGGEFGLSVEESKCFKQQPCKAL